MAEDYAAPDWRGLCEELLRGLDENRHPEVRYPGHLRLVMASARESLAQPEPEVAGPSDEELLSLDQLRDAWNAQADAMNSWTELGVDEIVWWAQHQVLARWGRPAPAPAGEVGELVKRLRYAKQNGNNIPSKVHWGLADGTTHHASIYVGSDHADDCARAADLLERQAAPVPVAVSERLPGAKDCLGRPTEEADAGWCWTYSAASEAWSFQPVVFPRPYPDPPRVTLNPSVTHWLPHHALPLPSGETSDG